MASRAWETAMRADFALAVAEILRDWKAGDVEADEAMSRVSYEYEDKIGELADKEQP